MLDFHRNIDGFESGDLYAVCIEFEVAIEQFGENGELSCFDDVVEFLLSKEQYDEYIEETGSEETYEEYKSIREYVAKDKNDYFVEMVNLVNNQY